MRLIYFSPVNWNSYSQRPHEFVRYYRRKSKGKILWIEPYPTRLPRFGDLLQEATFKKNIEQLGENWITILKPMALPIEPIPFGHRFNRILLWQKLIRKIMDFGLVGDCIVGIGKPSALALISLGMKINVKMTFYDAMDDFPAFYKGLSHRTLARYEKMIINSVDKVVVSSSNYYRSLERKSIKPILVHNGCNTRNLPKSKPKDDPHPVKIGFVGTISEWFDWDLVIDMALLRPDIKFEMVGPVHKYPSHKLPKNMVLIPPCANDEAIIRMQNFSIGLIPFKINRLTESVDPIKYYEYRSIGIPIISTKFGEMAYRENENGVYLLDDGDTINSVIDTALTYRSSNSEILEFRKNNDWDNRFTLFGLI
jgi:glycosyltransferase involved in cell wall biosynthesis